MEVSKVSCIKPFSIKNTNKLNNTKCSNVNNNSFQPCFTGYERILQNSVKNVLNNDIEVEKTFCNLFVELADDNIIKQSAYYDVARMYTKKGFRSLLYEFWKSNPVDCLKKYLKNETINIAEKDGKPIFQLVHLYKFGFSKDSPNDVKFVFLNPKNGSSIQYGLNKKGELEVWQNDSVKTAITTYHMISGNKKCVVEQALGGNPETTYYNKDGSKAFFKNLFWGGVAIIPK